MNDDRLSLMPEHPFPGHAAGCELAAQRTRMTWGEGTPGAPVLVLLDNPKAREDKYGAPFFCGTRQHCRTSPSGPGCPSACCSTSPMSSNAARGAPTASGRPGPPA
jgi:hypothetical protein